MSHTEDLIIRCKRCGNENAFAQPYSYHAGFGNQGFLYDDAGALTLVWSCFDPAYVALVGEKHAWALMPVDQGRLEEALHVAPSGGHWRFANPARCLQCGGIISEPMLQNISYLVYPGSVVTDDDDHMRLGQYLNSAA